MNSVKKDESIHYPPSEFQEVNDHVLHEWAQRKSEWKKSWWRRMSSDVITPPPPLPRNNSCVDISSTHINTIPQREYWMIYWGPGSLAAVLWFGYSPTPSPPSRQKARPATHTHRRTNKRNNLLRGERGRGVGEELNPATARKSSPL